MLWMVNFVALGQFFKILGGDYRANPNASGLKLAAFSTSSFDNLPETSFVLRDAIGRFGPYDYFNLKNVILAAPEKLASDQMLSYFELNHWYPRSVLSCSRAIMKRETAFTQAPKALLSDGLKRAVMNVYPMPDMPDQYHGLGRLFKLLGMYMEALLCFLSLLNTAAAIEAFTYVLELEPENEDSKRWLERLKEAGSSPGVLKSG